MVTFLAPPKDVERYVKEIRLELGAGPVELIVDIEKKHSPQADAILAGLVDRETIERADKLRFLQLLGAGTDKIDFPLLGQKEVVLANCHGNASVVAEHGFALLLALAKDIINEDRELRRGAWTGWRAGTPTVEVAGKTLGIVGLGNIGTEMAKRAHSFGMFVVGLKKDPHRLRDGIKAIVSQVFSPQEIRELIQCSNFIFISTPLTPATRGLIGRKELSLMEGKYLINVSRGEVVEEEALYDSLRNNGLKGAGIDAWYHYPQEGTFASPSRFPFHELRNVIMTPHSAGVTVESRERNWKFGLGNIVRFFTNGTADNIVYDGRKQ